MLGQSHYLEPQPLIDGIFSKSNATVSFLLSTMLVLSLGACATRISDWAQAVKDRDLHLAKEFIFKKNALNSTNLYQDTPLLWAARTGQLDVVKFLLHERLANVDQRNTVTGETALILAAKENHPEIVRFLSTQSADSMIRDNTGRSAQDWAAQKGNNQLLVDLARGNLDDDSRFGNANALVSAVYSGKLATVRQLATRTGTVNDQDVNKETPIVAAAKIGSIDIARFLIAQGADTRATDSQGRTPFILAVQSGHINVVSLLIDNGADVNQQKFDGYPALFFAAANGQTGMVQLLLDKGASADATSTDKRGKTALLIAAQTGRTHIAVLLLNHPVDVNKQTSDGDSALMFAAANGRAGMVDLLLRGGANPNLVSKAGHSAIYVAANNGHWYVCEQLLAGGTQLVGSILPAINKNPRTAAPLFDIAGRYYLGQKNKGESIRSIKMAADAYRNTARTYRSDAQMAKLDVFFAALGASLADSLRLYARQEKARMNAQRLAQTQAVAGARTYDDYYRRSESYEKLYGATRSCVEKLSPRKRRRPFVSPDEATGLNQERPGQCNEAPDHGAGYRA